MLSIISKGVAAVALIISSFSVLNSIVKEDSSHSKLFNIFLLVLFGVITVVLHNTSYSPLAPIIIFLFMIIIYKTIYSLSLKRIILVSGVIMIIYFVADLITSIIFLCFVNVITLRTDPLIIILSNFVVCLVAVSISFIKPLMTKIRNFINNLEKNKYYDRIVFVILMIVVFSLIVYNIATVATLSISYLINVLVMVIFFLLTFIFVKEKNDIDKLNGENDNLMQYVENFEDWIEEEQLNNHEYKNQLAVIRTMAEKNKKITDYIDSILKSAFTTEDSWFNEIKFLPSGGIRGLLYYKLILTKKENINVCLSVSRDVDKFISNIEENELKSISRLLGIYLDNAIEASKNSSKRMISVEIYYVNEKLNFVISNTYDGKVDLKKINKKGYTTKGKGHGKGLYFANKIIKKSKILSSENTIINDYYVQKLVINS